MSSDWSALPQVPLQPPEAAATLDAAERAALLDAAGRQRQALQALSRGGTNVVAEILKGQGTFYEMNHFPEGDVFDDQSHCQYYYHAHREDGEHGHFHTFVRRPVMPADMRPSAGFAHTEPWPEGDDELAHLICISMDSWGLPAGLFATNRWVTDQTWYSAEDSIRLLDAFAVDHARPNLAVNQWLTQFMRLYRPQIAALLRHRDRVIAAWQQAHPGQDVLEDRTLEITGYLAVDTQGWISELEVLVATEA
ncbi:DUF6969 family protein [Marinobacterium rhizophilum]|uniref:DUF6969 domain-containing protein n=1 Tax=Marinobacterium rhizophilum TaxID=420402 RepID=A0ABY5HDV5_9GAMM|nr:hypothetical protein [Marinobacterium rhizophilum]UTW10528.1 hypothetical protein KDW95_14645 [Marinobacterium rhizophilum]